MRIERKGIMRLAIAAVAAVVLVCGLAPAQAATLEVADIFVNYDHQSAMAAKGTIRFNLRFSLLSGDPGGYDHFSAQVAIAKVLIGNEAGMSLDAIASENTGPIGPSYWLPAPPTNNELAITIGDQFRFRDYVSIAQAITPAAGLVVAQFVLNFDVTSADQFGEYEIARGTPSVNFFAADVVNVYPNTFAPKTFFIVPEPASGMLLLFGGAFAIVCRGRRGRRSN